MPAIYGGCQPAIAGMARSYAVCGLFHAWRYYSPSPLHLRAGRARLSRPASRVLPRMNRCRLTAACKAVLASMPKGSRAATTPASKVPAPATPCTGSTDVRSPAMTPSQAVTLSMEANRPSIQANTASLMPQLSRVHSQERQNNGASSGSACVALCNRAPNFPSGGCQRARRGAMK